jgi:hypothetical protein
MPPFTRTIGNHVLRGKTINPDNMIVKVDDSS